MNKAIIAIMFGIALISLISAETIIAGNTVYYDFTDEVDVIQEITWEVVNNTYNLEGLNITTNLTGAIVSIDTSFKPDNFTIIFTITGKNEQVEVVPRSGRGGRIIEKNITKYKEIPIYIDKKVEVIKEIENIEKIEEQEKYIKRLRILLGFLFAILVITTFI
ncbi:hypothetical protein LCGC14_2760040, partial [marine sediment metagenome]